MTPVPDPQGWGRTDGLLVRQPVRAEARRLFIGSGSLTWLLRPRLASPESTLEVEASHPLVKVQQPSLYRDPTGAAARGAGHAEPVIVSSNATRRADRARAGRAPPAAGRPP